MREDRRGRRSGGMILGDYSFKYLLYLAGGVLIIVIITFIITFISYRNKLQSSKESLINIDKISQVIPDEPQEESKSASIDIGKTIDEVISIMENSRTSGNNLRNNSGNTEKPTSAEIEEPKNEPPPDPEFTKPVEGEILLRFCKRQFDIFGNSSGMGTSFRY